MTENNFESKMIKQLCVRDSYLTMLKLTVFKRCVESGFLSFEDRDKNTLKYQWFEKVFEKNYHSLNLLETIMVNTFTPSSLKDVDCDVKQKTSEIIKDISKRIMLDLQLEDSNNSSSDTRGINVSTMSGLN
ncbi:hypothetical protein ACEWBT_17795 [Vibrio parahaemolyticus]|uniref:hypothetical protein n=1 Tax=Vibrio harveyi group TaxID=717610 RepID=UPI00186A4FB3|nr:MULTISPECIES: hypothetical protein [Vibrio harveyi group]EHR1014755.1 hypothetical protein [Vibrio parahaemolyticus]EHR6401434.1 hypothetical protein [Vibrio parahaemolyticus]EIU7856221.1 hypothetical protein [Vibrio parahaemolyticus]EJQ8028678.1 hypothetical protein [Vibrio parahaemolyticus]EKA7381799.1 hypothetical protein [Vibrio parahaemolyticus]